MKEAGYTRTSKNKKEELKLVAEIMRRHTRENNKYKLKSKDLNNPSLMDEVIIISQVNYGQQVQGSTPTKST